MIGPLKLNKEKLPYVVKLPQMYECPILIAKWNTGIFFLIGIYSIQDRTALELQSMEIKENQDNQNENHARKLTEKNQKMTSAC